MSATLTPDVGGRPATRRIWNAIVQANGPVTQRELAEQLGIDRADICRHVARLRERGLLEIGWDPQNPRTQIIEPQETYRHD